MRSVAYLLRVVGQGLRYSLASRRLMLWVLIVVAPVLVALAMVAGAAAPFAVYPFL